MAVTYQDRNLFTPVSQLPVSTTTIGSSGGLVSSNGEFNHSRDWQQVADYLNDNGSSNPDFKTSTTGRLTPGDRPRILRGFIRRANQTSGNPMAGASLRFMYNPETIQRDYVSYLDQAAIDPFNTIFQSGNQVAAPSVVQFSFDLFFDRQIEAAGGTEGVLADYKYFDMVVRNVPPTGTGTSNEVPDNGVMMVNPEDIVVVFSKDLTVQGRPTNARVNFERFDNKMTPTRMTVSMTMVVNYFGPLRDPFSFDSAQSISDYSALIPYEDSDILETILVDIAAGIAEYQANREKATAEYRSGNNIWWNNVVTVTSNLALNALNVAKQQIMNGPVSSQIAVAALNAAVQVIVPGVSRYAGGINTFRRTDIPNWSDCTSLVWWAFKQVGAEKIFGPGAWPDTAHMLAHWKSTNWSTMQQVHSWQGSGGAVQLGQLAQPGDLLFILRGTKHHIAFVQSNDGKNITNFAAHSSSSNPQVGPITSSIADTANQFDYLLRPSISGAQTTGGAYGVKWGPGAK